ncbi:LCP family protein [Paratractidigestivibacter sp.]|uniref:LCP family protein n=1 Tax=Paratractidigestivibacter sp. TaxID=2847316 RepID=UPI002ABD5D19|nr:LCP family protein [Paratractidigestivibacter sp.]
MADRRSSNQQPRPQSRQAYEESARRCDASSGASCVPTRAAGAASYARKRQARTRKLVIRGVLIGLLCVVLAGGSAVAMYLANINSRLTSGLDQSTKDLLADSVQYDDPFYMLLLGVDKSVERTESEEYGADDSNFRADSIILARIDPKAQLVTLVSLHRDTLTDMSDKGAGTQKLNAAYSIGGPSYMVTCVEKLCGVDISHYAEVDFEQFTGIVDSIGGVTVDLPRDIQDDYSGANLKAGVQTLNGEEALALARSRHAYDADGDGDIYRAANQRMVIAAIVKKVLTLDLASMINAVSQLASGVTTDINISSILGLAVQFKDLDVENNVYSGMEPTTGETINGIWYEKINETAWATMMQRIKEGKTPLADETADETNGKIATLVSDGSSSSSSSSSSSTDTTSDAATVEPEYSGTVCVVNVSGITGLATEKSELLADAGFTSETANALSELTVSKVVYNGSSSKAKAIGAAKTLGISESNVQQNDGTWTTSYDVVVVLCSDQA